jgi:hypothetical protein
MQVLFSGESQTHKKEVKLYRIIRISKKVMNSLKVISKVRVMKAKLFLTETVN